MPGFFRILIVILLLVYILSPYDLIPGHFLDDLILLGVYLLFFQFKRTGRSPWPGRAGPTGRTSRSYGNSRQGPDDSANQKSTGNTADGKRDPHEVLEIPRGAGPEEIRAAYRRLAQAYHPDKVAHLGPELRDVATRKFVEIQEAYHQLTGK